MKRYRKCGRENRTVCQEANKMFRSVLEVAGYTKIHIKCPEYYSIWPPFGLGSARYCNLCCRGWMKYPGVFSGRSLRNFHLNLIFQNIKVILLDDLWMKQLITKSCYIIYINMKSFNLTGEGEAFWHMSFLKCCSLIIHVKMRYPQQCNMWMNTVSLILQVLKFYVPGLPIISY